MERNLKIERKFNLGDYSNVTFYDEILNIPDVLVFNHELLAKIKYLQMLGAELAYAKYFELTKKVGKVKPEEVMKFLEEERTQAFEDIKNSLQKGD